MINFTGIYGGHGRDDRFSGAGKIKVEGLSRTELAGN